MKKGLTLLILLIAFSIAACSGTSKGVETGTPEPEDIQVQMMTASGARFMLKTDQDGADYFSKLSELGDIEETVEITIIFTGDDYTFTAEFSDMIVEVVKDGDAVTVSIDGGEPVPVTLDESASILENKDFTSVAVGAKHSCAVRASGIVYCWGDNSNGQLGASAESEFSGTPVKVDGLDHVDSLVASGDKTCALRSNRTVWCWGDGNSKAAFVDGLAGIVDFDIGSGIYGVVSYGEILHSALSGKVGTVGTIGDVVDVAVVGTTVYAVISDGSLWSDDYIDGISDVASVAANSLEVCAIQTNGDVYCWEHGATPGSEPIEHGSNVKEMIAGEASVCKLTKDNDLHCCDWGDVEGPKPTGLTNVTSASTQMDHTCAVAGGKVYCWGFNTHGELGDGTTDDHTTPTEIKF